MLEEINAESTIHSYITQEANLQQRVQHIRADLVNLYPSIHRIAIALYDRERGVLKTYACDEDRPSGLKNYEAILSECGSLNKLAQNATKRVLNDISRLELNQQEHTQLVHNAGYLSSVTIPLLKDGELLGFFFANSREKNGFNASSTKHLQMLSMFLTLLLHQDLHKISVLKSTIESLKIVNQYRDPETGAHLQRMAHFSLLIAREVAARFQLSDMMIGYIYLYAPLHDVGKLMVPDQVLFKQGRLNEEEFAVMKLHSSNGETLIKQILNAYDLADVPFAETLTAIVRSHHEKLDGSGYPDGLQGEQIPIAARIVAVADIFDALTSQRPYKKAWSVDEAFAELQALAGKKLDPHCVTALINNRQKVESIMASFLDGE